MSDLALKLIAENRKTQEPFLDLGDCGLTEIPVEVGDLDWITSMSLADRWFESSGESWTHKDTQNRGDKNKGLVDLTPLASLTGLQSLYVSGADVSDLGPLATLTGLQALDISRTKVSALTPLARLRGLKSLAVFDTQVSDLAPLASLTGLHTLFGWRTAVSDLAPLERLSGLQMLFVSSTPVWNLAPLASLTGLLQLDISSTQISDLVLLTALTGLQKLFVSATAVSDLAPLVSLTGLETLHASKTQICDLTPLATLTGLQHLYVAGIQVPTLAPLAQLTGLQQLDVSYTPVSDLAPLVRLTGLQLLNVSHTPVSDLTPLARLTSVEILVASHTRVSNLMSLAPLSGLQKLDVSHTPVSDLAPLARLTGLQIVDVSNSQVSDLSTLRTLLTEDLPARWSSGTWGGPGLYVENCPLTNPPPEIVKQGNVAILNYFLERELRGVDHLYEAKMLILGEGGAGKTSLLRRLYQPEQSLPGEDETTKGISIHRHEFSLKSGRRFRLNIWDFGGQEIYHATHQFFLTRRSLYVLVDDTRKDHRSVSDEGFKYWLELIDLFGGHSPALIFQNEKGGRSKAIDFAGIKGRYDNVQECYSGNLEHTDAAERLRQAIEFHASNLSHIGEELPAHWIRVRADIEARANDVPHITRQEYFDIYSRHLELDRTKALHLSQYLHDLGVFLHFQDHPLLARTVILQNAWATDAVFGILDDEAIKDQRGRFTNADCERLWQGSAYAEMHLELLALMQRFELCYALPDTQPQTWLAPELLPAAKPATLGNARGPDDLVLRYVYEFLPKGTISRLTVRLHRFVRDPDMAWVTGVLFERESSRVLVEVLATGREIELRASGPERKALLTVIAADLDALNESFQGLRERVDKRIPCNCRLCRTTPVPEFFAEKALLRRKEDNRLKVECPNSYENVDVLELLEGIRVDKLPEWANQRREVNIFLASSSELRDDRDQFDLYFRQLNDQLTKRGLYLKIHRWENFLDAISETRLQDEYNKAVRASDVFVGLFFTKCGKFTEEEFEAAYGQFKSTGRPSIYTYFKHAPVNMGDIGPEVITVLQFKEKLRKLGHFYTSYNNIEDLKLQFQNQLDKLLD